MAAVPAATIRTILWIRGDMASYSIFKIGSQFFLLRFRRRPVELFHDHLADARLQLPGSHRLQQIVQRLRSGGPLT